MLVDSHAHLEDEKYDLDREKVIDECRNELTFLINVGSNIKTSLDSIELAKKYEFIYAAVGIHPHDAKNEFENLLDIEKLGRENKVVAIGEVGLDYFYDEPLKEFQKQVFINQINIAKKLNLPVIIHDRDAHKDVFDILKKEWTNNLRGVFHSYSGSAEMIPQCMELNFYISLGGPVTFKNAKKTVEVAKKVPIDRLLIETDSPYLTPEPYRGKRNSPVNVKFVAQKIAELRNMRYEEVCNITGENTARLFGIKL